MYSFNGTFTYRLDDKNRIRIPAKFKKDLGSDYKLTLAPGNCLSVLPQEEYAKILEGFGRVPYFDEAAQRDIAAFTSCVFDVSEDPQGRIVLPEMLKKYANIDRDIVIMGAATHIRIESAEAYEARTAKTDLSALFVRLNSYGKKDE